MPAAVVGWLASPLCISQVGNEEAVNKLLEENLDEDGNPRPLKKEGKRNNGGVDWRELV